MNQQNVNYSYNPQNPGFQGMVVPNATQPMGAKKGGVTYFDYWNKGKYTKFWFINSFIIHAFFSFFLVILTIIGMSSKSGHFPLLKTLYTSKYGDLPDNVHPTLYGLTTILTDSDVGYKPVPSVPVSFQDIPLSDGTRKDSYYYCVDGTLNYTTQIGGSVFDQIRAKGICMVERYSAVATYENHESSMTFSSAWSPMFMITVVMLISTSWQLLYVDFKPSAYVSKSSKYYLYVAWQVATLFFIMIVSYLRINDHMMPRNNIVFAAGILVFSVIQQMYIMNKYGEDFTNEKSEEHLRSSDINFIRKLYDDIYGEDVKKRVFSQKTLGFIVLLSDWFLLPIFCISVFALLSNNVLEWVFQATYVRYQLIIFGFVLIQQIKVIEEKTDKKKFMRTNPNKNYLSFAPAFEFHPRLVILIAVIFAIISEVISMTDTWATRYDHTVTRNYALFYILSLSGYVGLVAFWVMRSSSSLEYGNKDKRNNDSGTWINFISSVVRVIFTIILISYLFNDYNKYSCFLNKKSTSLFCGHSNPLQNLNNKAFISPIALTSGNAATVFDNLYDSITYDPLS
eukprot:746317-Hanusia_phi.AAC.1